MKAAECHKKNGDRFHAGKSLEQAALVSRDLKDYEKTAGEGWIVSLCICLSLEQAALVFRDLKD